MQITLKKALKNWPDWGLSSEPSLDRIFTQGQNHHTGLIKAGEKCLVLKVFSHSFDRTIDVERWASTIGLSPNIVYAQQGVQLLEFIDDQGYQPSKLTSLARSLKCLHGTGKAEQHRFDLIEFANDYLVGADALTQQWHVQLLPIIKEFINDPTPWTFCHNDLVVENCLFKDNGNVVLIDWEFAQYHNPWFDLAAIIHYFKLSESQTATFLNAYATGWSAKTRERIFITSQMALLWIDLLWNMHQSGAGYRENNSERFAALALLAQQLNIVLTLNS